MNEIMFYLSMLTIKTLTILNSLVELKHFLVELMFYLSMLTNKTLTILNCLVELMPLEI